MLELRRTTHRAAVQGVLGGFVNICMYGDSNKYKPDDYAFVKGVRRGVCKFTDRRRRAFADSARSNVWTCCLLPRGSSSEHEIYIEVRINDSKVHAIC